MARITLIRHGKAEMPRIGENDFERGLIQRGMQNAEVVGQFMQAHKAPVQGKAPDNKFAVTAFLGLCN